MQWKNGRQLSQVKTSKDTITYKYNIKALRTRKYNSDYTYYYYYDDNNNLIAMMQGGVVAYFYYDSNNSVTAMSINDSMYYYIKNLQGDITKIVNHQGKVMVEYTYDAWGNILKEKSNVTPSYATVQDFNPFRYRGYVYDTDTGLYYLQSRYYDPKTGRFINADDTAYVDTNTGTPLSTNMFAYCENNVINNIDYNGYKSRHCNINSSWVSWGIDLIIMFFCPGASISYDVVGFALKRIYRKLGFKKSLDFLLKTAIPKCKGLFSKFFTTIRRIIWRVTGLAVSWLRSSAVNAFFGMISNFAKRLYKRADKAIMLITGLFSFGSFIATVLDIISDKNLNGKIRMW